MTHVYSVVEVFSTIQGEGALAGTRSLFIRLGGCNMWSGHDEDRDRDADRNKAECPRWCDTDFVGGSKLSHKALVDRAVEVANKPNLIVITGGEPGLQLRRDLITDLGTQVMAPVAIETNGTVDVTPLKLDWICVSPKISYDRMKQIHGDELKIVYPAYNPSAYLPIIRNFTHLFVQPEATTLERGRSLLTRDYTESAIKWVLDHPNWRLSMQQHKALNLP